ncbi:MAG TPA: metallophosphoesterase [Chloroflexota bacterium]|nr:metallophosphoesterase [Chloroflexota bacterium]
MAKEGKGTNARRQKPPLEVVLPGGIARAVARISRAARRLQPGLDLHYEHVRIPGLPPALDGFLIAQISDLHVGDGDWSPYVLEEAAAALATAEPDLMVNTGDYLQGAPPLDRVRQVVETLTAPSSLSPAFSVLGNHDYYAGEAMARELGSLLEALGVRLISNEVVTFEGNGASLTLAGLNPYAAGLEAAIVALGSAVRPRIVLVHEADVVERLPHGGAELALAGHTHGGQVTVPVLRPLIVRLFNGSRYLDGMYVINGVPTYINRGLGYTGVPFRFRAAPEVTFFRLVR